MAVPSSYPGAPRWVKILGIIALALAITFVVVHLAGGGFHHGSHFGPSASSSTPTERGQ
jgi:hypothetical protein